MSSTLQRIARLGVLAAGLAAASVPLTIAMRRCPSRTRCATTSADAPSLSTDTQGCAGCAL